MPEDPFVVVAGGRAPFHLEGLRRVVGAGRVVGGGAVGPARAGPLDRLARRQADYAVDVSRILPLMTEGLPRIASLCHQR